jgi:Ser/Thr protein kinase RdoA (MazF antagonist)
MLHVELEPLPGGLQSAVNLAHVATHGHHIAVPSRIVVKELRCGLEREAAVYEWLWRDLQQPPAVRVLGRERVRDATYLYLEAAQPFSSWPWADTRLAAAVCRELGRLHDNGSAVPADPFAWNYEDELAHSAETTLQFAGAARDPAGTRYWRRLGDLRRVVAGLPAVRSRLLAGEVTLIHGDVHPGNVFMHQGQMNPSVVLIDWGRSRLGSPLEDVASWLHSLGCWEPHARRRHDTLMRAYLDSRHNSRPFSSTLRVDYWFASVSNGLSGAIRYHLAVVADPRATDAARYDSGRALVAWQRVVRRAAALLSTSHARSG